MSHKINDLHGSGPAAGTSLGGSRTAGATAVGSNSGTVPAEAVASTAEVHITDTASRLANLEPALREAPAVDAARVAAIRAALEQGQYAMKPDHIATGLVQMEQALGQLRARPIAVTDTTPADEA